MIIIQDDGLKQAARNAKPIIINRPADAGSSGKSWSIDS